MAEFDFYKDVKIDPCMKINFDTGDLDLTSFYKYVLNGVITDTVPLSPMKYRFGYKTYDKLSDIPEVDIHEWAKKQGLKISEDGKTLTCYKAVEKTKDGKYKSCVQTPSSFEYKIGEYAFAEELDRDRFSECRPGLHAGNMSCAKSYACSGLDRVVLELKVDISDPDNYVIPYSLVDYSPFVREALTSNKFRFKSCYVVREIYRCKKVWYDSDTGEMWEM